MTVQDEHGTTVVRGEVGTFVKYVGSDGRVKAALVVAEQEDGVRDLQVFSPTGRIYFSRGMAFDAQGSNHSWS